MSENEKSNSSKGSAAGNDSVEDRGNGPESNSSAGQGPQRLSDETSSHQANDKGADSLALAQEEVQKFKNEYLYLRAEFDNFKRNTIKERSDLRKYGSERLAVDLLNVLDIFDTALSAGVNAENFENFKKGIELTAQELRNTLQRHGVEEAPAKGQPFDPTLHEALSSEETDEVPAGTITNVFKKPYKLHDRVIRHGQVIVAKPKS